MPAPTIASDYAKRESAVESIERGEGADNGISPALPPKNIGTGIITDEVPVVQGKEDNTHDSLTLPQADPLRSEAVEREEAENLPPVPPTTPPRTQSDESEEAMERRAEDEKSPRTAPPPNETTAKAVERREEEDTLPPAATAAKGHTERDTVEREERHVDSPLLPQAATPQAATPQNESDNPEEVGHRRGNGDSSPPLLQTSSPKNELSTAEAIEGGSRLLPPQEETAPKSNEEGTDGVGDAENLPSPEPRSEHAQE